MSIVEWLNRLTEPQEGWTTVVIRYQYSHDEGMPHAQSSHFSMVLGVLLENFDIVLETIRVVGVVHPLEIRRRMEQSIDSGVIHGQVWLDVFRVHLAVFWLMRTART
jgi:hypothetical protein